MYMDMYMLCTLVHTHLYMYPNEITCHVARMMKLAAHRHALLTCVRRRFARLPLGVGCTSFPLPPSARVLVKRVAQSTKRWCTTPNRLFSGRHSELLSCT